MLGLFAGALALAALAGCGGAHAPKATRSTGTATTAKTHTSASPPQAAPKPQASYPKIYTLGNDKVAQWAVVLRNTVARKAASASSAEVGSLTTMTGDGTNNIVLVIGATEVSPSETWYLVRLPILPNNSVGYVRASDLSALHTVFTHLYVNRSTMTATLMRNGVEVFSTRVGVGRRYWPTPAGQFYIRDELTDFHDPFYGPIAFGTSARSAVLTDWPDGGFVGVHGTNTPQIIPGRISHGCIRMNNAAIVRLAQLMPVGTPLTVS